MPLTVIHKKESKSIEDLIAQLDAPKAEVVDTQMNGNGNESITNGERKLLKGKRNSSTSISSSNGNGHQQAILNKNILVSKKYSKNIKGRGLAKKGGSGGKHTWGAPGCELGARGYLDKNDPNYDSEDTDNFLMKCVENGIDSDGKSLSHLPHLYVDHFDPEVKLVLLEYFHNGDPIEVIDHLKCYNLTKCKPNLLVFIIQLALDHNDTCKELVSRLLRDFNVELFSTCDYELAFEHLFKSINDLTLDNPNAAKNIGIFLARCIADRILTKDFLQNFPHTVRHTDSKIDEIINEAFVLTNMNDRLFNLAHIWGHNQGGFTAVKALTDKVIIQEYYDSGDVKEAIQCLHDLNVPHFNHEFIFEALDFALQKSGDNNAIAKITKLIEFLCDSVVVTYDQLKMGFVRVFEILPDICLDVPCAYQTMEQILTLCHETNTIHSDIVDLAPSKSRKRMISEGDGIVRFKENDAHTNGH